LPKLTDFFDADCAGYAESAEKRKSKIKNQRAKLHPPSVNLWRTSSKNQKAEQELTDK
jgi:hypothetical protein